MTTGNTANTTTESTGNDSTNQATENSGNSTTAENSANSSGDNKTVETKTEQTPVTVETKSEQNSATPVTAPKTAQTAQATTKPTEAPKTAVEAPSTTTISQQQQPTAENKAKDDQISVLQQTIKQQDELLVQTLTKDVPDVIKPVLKGKNSAEVDQFLKSADYTNLLNTVKANQSTAAETKTQDNKSDVDNSSTTEEKTGPKTWADINALDLGTELLGPLNS